MDTKLDANDRAVAMRHYQQVEKEARRCAALEAELAAGIAAVQKIVGRWSSGDLAGAVNEAEDWAVQASDMLDDEVST